MIDTEVFEHLPGDHRLVAQALQYKGERLPGELEDEGRLAPRGV
jgi:hypothetical protein